MRATPASRSRRARGRGDWWNEVRITASSGRNSSTIACSSATRSASTGREASPIHGHHQVRTDDRPGSSAAAGAPCGPASSSTSASAAIARTAGPHSSTSPALSRRATSTRRVMRSPRRAASRGAARPPRGGSRRAGSGRHLLLTRDRGGDEHAARTGGGRGAHVGADVADHGEGVGGEAEGRRGVEHHPGRGLPAVAAVLGSVRAEHPDVETAEDLVDPAVDRLGLLAGDDAAGDARLVRDDSEREPGLAGPRHRVERGGHRLDQRRVAVVRHVDHEGRVAVEEDPAQAGRGGALRVDRVVHLFHVPRSGRS